MEIQPKTQLYYKIEAFSFLKNLSVSTKYLQNILRNTVDFSKTFWGAFFRVKALRKFDKSIATYNPAGPVDNDMKPGFTLLKCQVQTPC